MFSDFGDSYRIYRAYSTEFLIIKAVYSEVGELGEKQIVIEKFEVSTSRAKVLKASAGK